MLESIVIGEKINKKWGYSEENSISPLRLVGGLWRCRSVGSATRTICLWQPSEWNTHCYALHKTLEHCYWYLSITSRARWTHEYRLQTLNPATTTKTTPSIYEKKKRKKKHTNTKCGRKPVEIATLARFANCKHTDTNIIIQIVLFNIATKECLHRFHSITGCEHFVLCSFVELLAPDVFTHPTQDIADMSAVFVQFLFFPSSVGAR